MLTPDQFAHLLNVIKDHRYPEKNTALVQISFKLGLRVQEIALLQIKDVAELRRETSGQLFVQVKRNPSVAGGLHQRCRCPQDTPLITAIEEYLPIRLASNPLATKSDSLFLTQKGGPTLQTHCKSI